jgi:hypothetical protein
VHTGFWWGTPKERHQLEDLGIDGRITKTDLQTGWGWWGSKDWIYVSEGTSGAFL